jgi:hypothetical protein
MIDADGAYEAVCEERDELLKEVESARGEAEKWRYYGLATWYHEQLVERGALHLVARGYLLPGHDRRVFSQADALAELGVEEPKFPWETK